MRTGRRIEGCRLEGRMEVESRSGLWIIIGLMPFGFGIYLGRHTYISIAQVLEAWCCSVNEYS